MNFQEFQNSRWCRPLVLPDEEQPQDPIVWRELVRKDQERQFELYRSIHQETESPETGEEQRVKGLLNQLIKKNLPVPVQAKTDGRQTYDTVGEARERTKTPTDKDKDVSDSRGGQTPQQRWKEKKGKAYFAQKQKERRARKKLREKSEQ